LDDPAAKDLFDINFLVLIRYPDSKKVKDELSNLGGKLQKTEFSKEKEEKIQKFLTKHLK